MKILVIMGSPRKGNTFRACEELRESMQQYNKAEFEYLWLKDANLLPCKGCLSCFSHGEDKCPNHDDALVIEQKMLEADGVVFASPVYGLNVTGLMKNFIDRFCYIIHRPRFFDKKALLLATTGAIGDTQALKYMATIAGLWGFEISGKVGLITNDVLSRSRADNNKKRLTKSAKNFSAALERTKRKSPGIMDVIIFHAQRAVFSQMEKSSPCDYHYWNEKGWLSPGARYFVDVPVNPVYQLIGSFVEWILIRRVRKDLVSGNA